MRAADVAGFGPSRSVNPAPAGTSMGTLTGDCGFAMKRRMSGMRCAQ